MVGKFNDPSIDSMAPWSNDVLERRAFGEMVVQLIDGIVEPFVISLKGGGTSRGHSPLLGAADIKNFEVYLRRFAPGAKVHSCVASGDGVQ